MKKWICCFMILVLIGMCGCSDPHKHVWQGATCENAAFCTGCGKTQGEPLEHDWKNATCTTSAVCNRCGKTFGEPLEHMADERKLVKADAVSATGIYVTTCITCGCTLEEMEENLSNLHDGERFLFTSMEFATRLEQILHNGWDYGRNCVDELYLGDEITFYLTEGSSADPLPSLFIFPMRDDGFLLWDEKDDACIDQISMVVPEEHLEAAMDIIAALIPTCDPSFGSGYSDDPGFIDVLLLMEDIAEQKVRKNGLVYRMKEDNNNIYLLISVD